MHNPALIRALVATACALPILSATGCKEEEPSALFDEEGAWVLKLFKLEDGLALSDFGSPLRQEKFMLYYDKEAAVVAAAACNDSMGVQGVTASQCDLPKEAGGYYCRCFSYEYDDDTMVWTEFVPDGQPAPPAPTEDELAMGVSAPDAGVLIALEAYDPDSTNNTYRYTPLPYGLFDSNGASSEYVFQSRGPATFDATGCREVCGIAAEPAME